MKKNGEYVVIVRLASENLEPQGPSSTVTAVSKLPSLSQSSISNASGASVDYRQQAADQLRSQTGWSDGKCADAQELMAVSGNGPCRSGLTPGSL